MMATGLIRRLAVRLECLAASTRVVVEMTSPVGHKPFQLDGSERGCCILIEPR